jgi:hypothetical protein
MRIRVLGWSYHGGFQSREVFNVGMAQGEKCLMRAEQRGG